MINRVFKPSSERETMDICNKLKSGKNIQYTKTHTYVEYDDSDDELSISETDSKFEEDDW